MIGILFWCTIALWVFHAAWMDFVCIGNTGITNAS